ncbi:hypothetical protein [Myxosarcina sp. GI1]|nr:hypothetical protein [Myxosarcina sp. GI1]
MFFTFGLAIAPGSFEPGLKYWILDKSVVHKMLDQACKRAQIDEKTSSH